MICFYHRGDLDGHCAGAIVRHRFPEARMIGLDYEDDFDAKIPWHEIIQGTEMVMVDFCLPDFMDMIRLQDFSGNSLIWIDHHKTAMDKATEVRLGAPGLRRIGTAGCELTWEYFFPEKPMPLAVHLLGRYDVWDEGQPNWEGQILPFQYGMRGYQTDPSMIEAIHLWGKVLPKSQERFIDRTCDLGSRILQYQQIEDAKLMARQSFETSLDGLRALAVNHGPGSSMKFESSIVMDVPDHKFYPLCISFARLRQQKWLVNLYTYREDVDCGEIALRHGGGGHRKAAGFICEGELPFQI